MSFKGVKIKLYGASDTVTGSRTLLSIAGKHWLVDCGLFQGTKDERMRNWRAFDLDLSKIEGVVLTHAHLDHSGLLPRLVKSGYRGPIHCSEGTADLLRILLLDAAFLEEEFATYANQSGYSNHRPALPLFTMEDAEAALKLLKPHARGPQGEWIQVSKEASFRFIRAGHIIGASMVQWSINTHQGPKLLTFSGDLGNARSLTIKQPEWLTETHALVLESTYGQRVLPRDDPQDQLALLLNQTFAQKGVVIIPAFAVGRAQELLFQIRSLEDQKRIPLVPVILDSPMAQKSTAIFLKHPEDHASPIFTDCGPQGDEVDRCTRFLPALFETSATANDSMLACMRDGPFVVISASGMLHGGRILHHLKHRLPDARNTLIFTGFQAPGTKGRWLLDRSQGLNSGSLRIHHQEVILGARIEKIDTFSSHADQQDLVNFIKHLSKPPEMLLLSHGEPAAQQALQLRLKQELGITAHIGCEKSEVELPWEAV